MSGPVSTVIEQESRPWHVMVFMGSKDERTMVGGFANEREAALAHDAAALRLRGGDAKLNFPDGAPARRRHGERRKARAPSSRSGAAASGSRRLNAR